MSSHGTVRERSSLVYLWLSGAVIVLDQISKAAVERGLQLYQSVSILPVLEITRLHNSGAAFSFLASAAGWQRWLFTALALLVSGVLALLVFAMRGAFRHWATRIAVCLLAAGVLGNLTDRILRHHVVDFLLFNLHVPHADPWPAFNVADSCICIGAGLLLLDSWLTGRRREAVSDSNRPHK